MLVTGWMYFNARINELNFSSFNITVLYSHIDFKTEHFKASSTKFHAHHPSAHIYLARLTNENKGVSTHG